MTIGIDASRANKDNKTGTEWYSYHLIEELKKISPENFRVFLYTNIPLSGDLGRMPAGWQEKVLGWPPKYLWTQIRLWWELILNPPDVLLVPAHTIPFLPISRKTRILVNVHDVGFKRFPELYKKIQIWYHDLTMKRIKQRADLIITISEFSKKEIIDLYGVNSEKIKVVYLGYGEKEYREAEASEEILAKYKIDEPYLLYVGRLEKKKNIGNLVKAFALAKAEHQKLKLVLAGSAGNDFEAIKKIVSDFKLEKEIILSGYIDEKDLPAIIKSSAIFVFATFYEGFGLPIIQAMASGAPVITSDMEPHREVAGGAAALADPRNPEAIAEQINKILGDDEFRNGLIEKGKIRAKDFSWKKTAEEVLKLI